MKDPAVLLYINDWLTSTAEMDADVRGWYLNLLLHNYDKKSLPNDLEKLAVLCNVKFSEFERFKQVFEQVFKHKFEQTDDNRLTNPRTTEILRNREDFKDKRSNAGKMSYIMKYFAKNYTKEYKNKSVNQFVKENFDLNIDLKNEQVFKQMFEQVFELYRNENENEFEDNNKDDNSESTVFSFFKSLKNLSADENLINDWLKVRKAKRFANTETAFNALKNEFEKANKPINEILTKCVTESWGGFKASWTWDKTIINNQKSTADVKLSRNR